MKYLAIMDNIKKIDYMRVILFFCLICISAYSSATTFGAIDLDEEGYFNTKTLIVKDGVIHEDEFMDEYKTLVYVMLEEETISSSVDAIELQLFLVNSIIKMNEFDHVFDNDRMETYLMDEGFSEEVSNLCDRVGLYNVSKDIGVFLVIVPRIEFSSLNGTHIARLEVFNAATGEYVLKLQNRASTAWDDMDDSLFYPLFNAFLQWIRGENIETSVRTRHIF